MKTTTLFAISLGLLAAAWLAPNPAALGQNAATQPANKSLEVALQYGGLRGTGPVLAPSEDVPASVPRENKMFLVMNLSAGPGLTKGSLADMARTAPKEVLSDEVRRQLQSPGNVIRVIEGPRPFDSVRSPRAQSKPFQYTIGLAAPTEQGATDLAHGLMAAYEYAWKQNGPKYMLTEIERTKKALVDAEREAIDANSRYEDAVRFLLKTCSVLMSSDIDVRKALAVDAPYSVGNDLRAKLCLVAAEIAALTAKIDAAKKLLKTTLPDSQREIINGILVKAQIDLAGLLSQQQTMALILNAVETIARYDRLFLQGKTAAIATSLVNLRDAMEHNSYASPAVGGVTMHPIRWMGE